MVQVPDSVYKDGMRAPVLSPSRLLRCGGRDMTRSLVRWEVDRAYNTDLPEAMRAFSGSSSAQFKFDLDSSDQSITGGLPVHYSAPALYGPWADRYAADIVRPGQSVNFAYGYSNSNLSSFRGTIRDRNAVSGTDIVSMSALDGAERLRSAAIVPRPYTTAVWDQYVLSPALVVDNLLRDAGIYSSPPPRFNNLLFISGHDGIYPYRGSYFLSNTQWTTQRSGAPFTAMAVPTTASPSGVTYVPRIRTPERGTNVGYWMEFFTSNVGFTGSGTKHFEWNFYFKDVDPANPDATYTWYIDWSNTPSSTGISANFKVTGAGSSSLGTSFSNLQTGTYHFGMFWIPNASTGAVDVQLRVVLPDKTVQFAALTTMPAFVSSTNRYLNYIGCSAQTIPFENFQFGLTTSQPAMTYAGSTNAGSWVRGAYFPDDCPFRYQYLPRVSGTKWDTISQIAAATLATAQFDEFGQFRWREYTQFNSFSAVFSITSRRELSQLTVREEIDSCRNSIQVASLDYSGFSPTGVTTQFASTGNIALANGATMGFVFPIDGDFEFDPIEPARLANTVVSSGNYVSVMNVSSGGGDANLVKSNIWIEGFHNENNQYQLNVSNYTGSTVWLYKSGGSGSGVLMAIPKDDTNFQPKVILQGAENTTSQSWYGKQSYYHDGGPWIQYQSSNGALLATALLNAGAYPIPILENVEVIPDARLQLGDCVQIVDRVGNVMNQPAWVIGINTQGEGNGVVRQTLTLRGTAYPGPPIDAGLTPDPPVDPVRGSTA